MKTQIVALTIAVFISIILFVSCGEKSKKDAKKVKEDVVELNQDLTRGAIHAAEEIKTVIKQEWEKFKTASESTIENTEKEIRNLRKKISKDNKEERIKLTKKLDELEQRYLVLKDKLAVRTRKFKENKIEFNEKAKEIEKAFEGEFNQEMKALEFDLKDLFKDNVNE